MNLAIDIGNTRIKTGFYHNRILQHFFAFDTIKDLISNTLFNTYLSEVNAVIVSNVSNNELHEHIKKNIDKNIPFCVVSNTLKLPLKLNYETPHTLGSDRIAAAVGAMQEFSEADSLSIDFGTCIKYNLVINKTFTGGAISPGLKMRYKALHDYTEKLPLLEVPQTFTNEIIGKNTDNNLHSGVLNGILAEVRYFIDNAITLSHQNLKVTITGGDAIFFEKLIERKVFLRPYLILNGLNELLEYQKK